MLSEGAGESRDHVSGLSIGLREIRTENNARAYQIVCVGVYQARWQEMKAIGLTTCPDRMPTIMSTCCPCADVEGKFVEEAICQLALPFVSPLRAKDNGAHRR